MFAAVIAGLLGAKLYYVVVLRNWNAMFDRGGFVFWGGYLLGSLAVLAVAFATINVVGGFLVTDRMLQMFKRKPEAN